MARTFSLQDTLAANESVFNMADLANHPFNSFADPAMVSLYAVTSAEGVEILSFQLGDQIHGQGNRLAIGASVSMRDNLVAQGVILPGQRMAISYRETAGATPIFRANIVIEELPED